jgi:dTDP-4-dehydrorhamnose reductase
MNNARILVTGANGFLGQNLVRSLLNNSFEVIATGKGQSRDLIPEHLPFSYYSLDLQDGDGFEKLFSEVKPTVIIHAGAMTQVDQCELHREDCYQVNVVATSKILQLANRYQSFAVFLSTDFVFDGLKGNYAEEDPIAPVNWYGKTKMEGEKMLKQLDIPWAIVRTCLVYGYSTDAGRLNIVTWVYSKLKKGEWIKVVDDQVRTPTYVEDLAEGITKIVETKSEGIFHLSGEETLTPYQMATKTAKHCGLDDGLIEKVNAQSFSQPAKRPAKTGFNIDKAKFKLGFVPTPFNKALAKIFINSETGRAI